MRNDPLLTIQKLAHDRYQNARAIFWAGSVVNNQGTAASDLDLIIVYEELPNAFRETFIFDEWPIDAFVHTIDTLRYFFEESKNGSGISGLIQMILHGQEITKPSPFSVNIKTLAEQFLRKGPVAWNKDKIDTERFLITDLLEDIEFPKTRAEQIASTTSLYDALAQFYFRSQNKWSASAKSIARYLELDNPALAQNFTESFECVFKTGNVSHLKQLIQKILQPYGGFLWDGYKSDAPKTAKTPEPIVLDKTNDGCPIYLEESINPEVAAILSDGLKAYNESIIGEYTHHPFTIYVKSADGSNIIGGCYGDITRTNCYVDYIWVDTDNRMHGIGAAIMSALESHAKHNHCQVITIETAEFQAKDFYTRLGYSIVSTASHNCFLESKVYLMRKSI